MILQNDLVQWFSCPAGLASCSELFELGRQLASSILLLCDAELALQTHLINELRSLIAGLCHQDGPINFFVSPVSMIQFIPTLTPLESLPLPLQTAYTHAWALGCFAAEHERRVLCRICHQIELCQLQIKQQNNKSR